VRQGHSADTVPKTMAVALRRIVIADVSMSLDDILAVAATLIARLLET